MKLCTEAPWPLTPTALTFASQLTKSFLSGEARPEATHSASQPIDPMPKQPKTQKPLKPRPITTQRVNERLAELAKATVDTLNSHDNRITYLSRLLGEHLADSRDTKSLANAETTTRINNLSLGQHAHNRDIRHLKIAVGVLAGIVACLAYAIVFCV